MLFTSSPAPVATLATEIFQTLATRQACGVAGCAVVRSVVALLPCGGADGCRRVAGRREVVPTPFGHTAVSVLRRITVTLSFLLPHFRRTPHSALVALAVRVANTHTHTDRETYTDRHTRLPRHCHIWLMASCDLSDLFFQFIVAQLGRGCQDNDVVLVSVLAFALAIAFVPVSVLAVVVVAPNGKLVRQGCWSRGRGRRRDVRRKCGKKCAFIF